MTTLGAQVTTTMRKGLRGCVVFAAAAVLLGGCSDTEELAEIDGETVTQAEFESYLRFKRASQDGAQRARLLDQYLEREALTQVIKRQDVLDEGLVQAELTDFKHQMYISRYFEEYLDEEVNEEAIRNYYASNPERFEHRKARVAHILFRTNGDMGEQQRQAKLTTAREALSKIKSGQDFAAIAKDYSEDAVSRKKGGELGWIRKGAIDPRFSDKVFSMESGEVAGPVETAYGYHLIKLLEGPSTVQEPFEKVKGDIRYQLRQQAKQAEMERLLEQVSIERGAAADGSDSKNGNAGSENDDE